MPNIKKERVDNAIAEVEATGMDEVINELKEQLGEVELEDDIVLDMSDEVKSKLSVLVAKTLESLGELGVDAKRITRH